MGLANVFRDIRFTLRMLYKSRSFAVGAILALGLGTGVGISIYTLVYSVAFRPFPVKEPENVKKIYQKLEGIPREVSGSPFMFSYSEYTHYRDNTDSFSDLIGYAESTFRIGEAEGITVPGLLVTANYFPALGVNTIIGRSFKSEEGQTPGTHPVAIISHRLWKERFNSAPDIIGRQIDVNRVSLTVIGVAGPEVVGTEITVPDVWVPLMMEPQVTGKNNLPKQNCSWLTLIGRLKPGVSLARAQAEMSIRASQLDTDYPEGKTTIIVSRGAYMGTPEELQVITKVMSVITVSLVFILLIVCTNVSNLFLAKTAAQQKEIAIRLAVGATRGRLIQQLLTESIVLGIIGGAFGLILARLLLGFLKGMIPAFPTQLDITPDYSIFVFALLISLISGISCGLAPAISATRLDLNSTLKQESSVSGMRKGSSKLRSILLIAQLGACLVLLISTALLVRGLRRAKGIELGFDVKNLYLVSLDLRQQSYSNEKAAIFYRELLERLEASPEVNSVSLASTAPLLARNQTAISLERNGAELESRAPINFNVVSPRYFEIVGIPLLSGPGFSEQNAESDAPLAIISEAMARRYWPKEDPIGKYFKAPQELFRVLGVAKNVHNVDLVDENRPFFYSLARLRNQLDMKLLLRTNKSGTNLISTLSPAVNSIDPSLSISAQSLENGLDRLLEPSRISILLSTTLGLLALIVATVGVYGVTAYIASQRTREIGIRIALGAQRSNIISLFIKQLIWPVAIGVVLGVAFAALASKVLVDLLFDLNTLDPVAFFGATMFLIFVALVAVYLPAARASKMNPRALM
jgi:predicted permease